MINTRVHRAGGMRAIGRGPGLPVLAFAMLFSLGCGGDNKHEGHDVQSEGSAQKEAMTYACPMHPDIIRNAPGLCPICGMQLTMRGGGTNVDLGPGIEAMLAPTNARRVSVRVSR